MKKAIFILCMLLCSNFINAQCNVQFWYEDSLGVVYFNAGYDASADYYIFDFGDGVIDTVDFDPVYGTSTTHNYSPPGTYNACVTIVDTAGCSATECNIVDANSTPCSVDWNVYATNDSVNTNQIMGSAYNNPANLSYLWDFGDGTTDTNQNVWHNYAAQGLYYVCLTTSDGLGCSHTQCDSIYSDCSANYTWSNSSSTFTFQNASYPNVAGTSYYWNFGDGSSSNLENPSHQFSAPGTYNVCLSTSGGGCYQTICHQVSVDSSYFCNLGFSVSLTGNYYQFTPVGLNAGFSYQWDFGDGNTSTDATPIHAFNATGNYTICLTVDNGNGCIDTHCQVLNVWNSGGCTAQFSTYDSLGVSYFYPGYNPFADYYIYDFGDGIIDTVYPGNNGYTSHQYNPPGTYYACLTVQDSQGCSDTFCDSVSNITPICLSGFSYYNSNLNELSLYNHASGVNLSYLWDFGDGTTSQLANPVHSYSGAGTYLVCLTVDNGNGCTDTYCDSVMIADFCNAEFTYANHCGQVEFANLSVGTGLSYNWDFGNGNSSTLENPIHQYNGFGSYNVELTITSTLGCSNSYTLAVQPTMLSNMYVSQSDSSGYCIFEIVNNDTSVQVVSAIWDFGNGAISTDLTPVHYFPYMGYNSYPISVEVIDNNGCIRNLSLHVASCVQPTYDCQAEFTVLDSATSIVGINQSVGDYDSYSWSFGDGGTSTQEFPSYTYSNYGSYDIEFSILDSSCADTAWLYLDILPITGSCLSNFAWYQASDSTIWVYNASLGTNISYHWDFGDGNTSNQAYPTHYYAQPGMYEICLTVDDGNGCVDTYCDSIQYLLKSTGFGLNVYPMSDAVMLEDGITELGNDLGVYPNPNNGEFRLEYYAHSSQDVFVSLYNAIGEQIAKARYVSIVGDNLIYLNYSEIPPGIYLLQLTQQDGSTSEVKLIKK